jgi:hypothetical protein
LLLAARDAELNQLKALVEQLADKVNAHSDTPAERLAAVEHRVDEVATHGVRLGTTLGLAAMVTHTDVDYSTRPRGFRGGAPEALRRSSSSWSALMAMATPLPKSLIPNLC